MDKTLLIFGFGYSARALARRLLPQGWQIIGTTRDAGKPAEGVELVTWPGTDLAPYIAKASHILQSIAPNDAGDPILAEYAGALGQAAPHLRWLGYLSTTGVYGDHQGGWVDEDTPLNPATKRGHQRVKAEGQWRALAQEYDLPLHIFRLAGIYGPGRGPFAKVRAGTARRIVKPGQVFSRIHVDDIAQVLEASIERPDPGAVYNVCDDLAAPPEDVLGFAAELLGLPLPPEEDYATAEMTPMARSFYAESKRVRNDRIKRELDVTLAYPTFREGLRALRAQETTPTDPKEP